MTCSVQAAAEVELEATRLEIEDGTEETGPVSYTHLTLPTIVGV